MNGTQITKRVKGRYPHVKILMLTAFHDEENINQAIVNGADGYLLKTDKLAEIAPNIKAIASGVSAVQYNSNASSPFDTSPTTCKKRVSNTDTCNGNKFIPSYQTIYSTFLLTIWINRKTIICWC